MMTLRLLRLAPVFALIAACGELPSSGPLAGQILASGQPVPATPVQTAQDPYAIVDINDRAIMALSQFRSPSLLERFGNKAPAPSQTVGIGDVVSISIWESGVGLFASGAAPAAGAQGASSVTLPPQVVDRRGKISVPYAAQAITAAGRTPAQIASAIEGALKSQASQPQVIVTVGESPSMSVAVLGDQTGSARVPLNIKGDRLLEVLAQAGGVKSQPAETFVTLTRGDVSETVGLNTILRDPSENIFLQPSDTIYVTRRPQTFTALGAVGTPGELQIDQDPFTLAQGVGRAGGLLDRAADASAVFVFRFEAPTVVRQLQANSPLLGKGPTVPVVYRLSFEDPRGYFYAQQFKLRSHDMVYVANASSVEFLKFLSVVRGAISVGTPATTVVSGG